MIDAVSFYVNNYRQKLFRFVVVGVITFLINNFLFWVFQSKFHFFYEVSITFAFFLTVAFHFSLNRFFTYSLRSEGARFFAIPKYLIMLVINYLITLSVVFLTVNFLGLSAYFGIFFSTVSTAFSSFLIMNHYVFSKRK